MTRRELIERNKVLRGEKSELFEQLERNKSRIDYVLPIAQYDSSKISDLRSAMSSDKAWIGSEIDSLRRIKSKIASNYETIGEYSRELEDLYYKKERAYDNKDYSEAEYIKGQIERVKDRRSEIKDKIDDLKRDRDRQADYISKMIDKQNDRYSQICSLKDSRDRNMAQYICLKEERARIKARLGVVVDEISRNQQLIDSGRF